MPLCLGIEEHVVIFVRYFEVQAEDVLCEHFDDKLLDEAVAHADCQPEQEVPFLPGTVQQEPVFGRRKLLQPRLHFSKYPLRCAGGAHLQQVVCEDLASNTIPVWSLID